MRSSACLRKFPVRLAEDVANYLVFVRYTEQPWASSFDMLDYKTLGHVVITIAHGARVEACRGVGDVESLLVRERMVVHGSVILVPPLAPVRLRELRDAKVGEVRRRGVLGEAVDEEVDRAPVEVAERGGDLVQGHALRTRLGEAVDDLSVDGGGHLHSGVVVDGYGFNLCRT